MSVPAAAPVSGAGYLKQGFALIRSPGIRRFALAPIGINILVFVGVIWFGVDFASGLIDQWLPEPGSWWADALRVVAWVVFASVVMLLLFFGFTAVANIIGAPFNGVLSQAVARHLSAAGEPGQTRSEPGYGALLATFPGLMWNEAGKVVYFAMIGLATWLVPTLLTLLIPGLNLVGTLLATVLTGFFLAWMHAVEYVDYPMSNREVRFREVRKTVGSRRWLCMGFGAAVMVVMAIPVVNLFAMPAAVAGATALWHDHFREAG